MSQIARRMCGRYEPGESGPDDAALPTRRSRLALRRTPTFLLAYPQCLRNASSWWTLDDVAKQTAGNADDPTEAATAEDAKAVLAASRVLVGLSVESMASVEDVVDVTNLRVLVVLASRAPMSLGELAAAAGLHLSRASRICERLVTQKLVSRVDDPADRRILRLGLTTQGHDVVDSVMAARLRAVIRILDELNPRRRVDVVRALRSFAAAGGESSEEALWGMGWTS